MAWYVDSFFSLWEVRWLGIDSQKSVNQVQFLVGFYHGSGGSRGACRKVDLSGFCSYVMHAASSEKDM